MSENYSKLEMALMELDRAVTGLSKQAETVGKTLQAAKRSSSSRKQNKEPDLFSMLSSPVPASARNGHGGEADFELLERKLDVTIAQIEDLLSEESLVAGHG